MEPRPEVRQAQQPEPWLRGPLKDVPAFAMPLYFSFAQVKEDLDRHVRGLTAVQIWQAMPGGSLGFHLKHLAGSVDRLTTYLLGEQLTAQQLDYLRSEANGTESADELLLRIEEQLDATQKALAAIDQGTLYEPRYVGRKRLPTSVFGLLVHLAEHTQRHLGQSITLAHLLTHTPSRETG